jgi:hypothetical protein
MMTFIDAHRATFGIETDLRGATRAETHARDPSLRLCR